MSCLMIVMSLTYMLCFVTRVSIQYGYVVMTAAAAVGVSLEAHKVPPPGCLSQVHACPHPLQSCRSKLDMDIIAENPSLSRWSTFQLFNQRRGTACFM